MAKKKKIKRSNALLLLALLAVLAFIPIDPTDVLDGGTPIIEIIVGIIIASMSDLMGD